MFGIPINVLPLAAMGTIVFLFGIRGFLHYQKVKSPLTLYYSWTGVLFGLSGIFYALPFAITSSVIILKSTVTIADLLFYSALMLQMRIIWYLGLKQKISFMWLFWPTLTIIIISLILDLSTRISAHYYVENNIAIFATNQTTLYLLALLSISIIVVGFLTLMNVRDLKKRPQKIRLTTLGIMFIFTGMTVEYNFLFLNGSNTSSVIVLGYAIAAIGFIIGLFFVRSNKKYV